MRLLLVGITWFGALAGAILAQELPAKVKTLDVICTFQDGKQISVRYQPGAVDDKEEFRIGRLYSPGSSPMFLFTQTGIVAGGVEIPPGAVSMYLLPEKKKWTLVINRNVTVGSLYDEKQDLARIPMQIGELSTPEQRIRVLFAHVAPKQCNMRIYYGQTGAWVAFKEK